MRVAAIIGSLLVFSIAAAQDKFPPNETLKTTAAERLKSFDLDAMDRSTDPCRDFFTYACGRWQQAHPIPPDQVRWGRFNMLQEYNRAQLRQLLETAAAKKSYRDTNEQKIGDFYATCIDESALSVKSIDPALPLIDAIDAINSPADLARVIADLHLRRVNALFTFRQSAMLHNAAMTGAWADQGGLGLPNRDFYTDTDAKSEQIRERYVQHVANMLTLLASRRSTRSPRRGR
jgi:endothelin-converting enzyme/putative endopeptidase